ncbi:MAG: hypothetical protein O3A63_14525, partial [Proteobacteria bacterium]|nr:hypothetical protein [Pseudomonadota bacterium]
MECIIRGSIICILAIICVNDALADDTGVNPDITALRAEVDELRTGYNARIAELERRLAIAEQNPQPPQYTSREIVAEPSSASSDSAFNPAIGVIFQGQAWHRDSHPNDYGIAGFPLGGEAGSFPQGLGLGEVEINISANVDDKFTAWLTVPVVVEGGEAGVEIEEAWIETTALPGGFSSR